MDATLTQRRIELHPVLIISDQFESAETIASLLLQKRYKAIVETNVLNAVQTAQIIKPAVIVLDLNLLRSDWAALIIELSLVTHAKILCVIPKANTWDIFALYEAGAAECLLRPVSPLLLLMKISALLVQREWMLEPSIEFENAFV